MEHLEFLYSNSQRLAEIPGYCAELCEISLGVSSENSLVVKSVAAAKSFQSCPTLCDPVDGSPLGSPVPGILQARCLHWAAAALASRRAPANLLLLSCSAKNSASHCTSPTELRERRGRQRAGRGLTGPGAGRRRCWVWGGAMGGVKRPRDKGWGRPGGRGSRPSRRTSG